METSKITDNRSIIEKADLAVADLADGGLMVPEQANKFFQIMIKESKFLPIVDVQTMGRNKKEVDMFRFGSRILRPSQEYQQLSLADRSKPELSKVTLEAKTFKAEVRLSTEDLEDNIEQGNLKDVVMGGMSAAIARDMEEIALIGDTSNTTDAFLASFDGVLKQASPHVYDHADANASNVLFREMLRLLPQEHRRDKTQLRFIVSGNTELDWRDALGTRQTPGGDSWLSTMAPQVSYTGIPVVDVPLMPENTGVGSNRAQALLLDPMNVVVGLQRQVTIETDRDIRAGAWMIVATVRFDVKLRLPDATVKAIKIKVS